MCTSQKVSTLGFSPGEISGPRDSFQVLGFKWRLAVRRRKSGERNSPCLPVKRLTALVEGPRSGSRVSYFGLAFHGISEVYLVRLERRSAKRYSSEQIVALKPAHPRDRGIAVGWSATRRAGSAQVRVFCVPVRLFTSCSRRETS